MKLLKLILFLSIILINSVQAKMVSDKKDGAIWIKSITTEELKHLYNQQKFFEFSKPNGKYPRIYLSRLPSDWQEIPENMDKQRTFIKILLPLVLKVNEDILKERSEIERINEKFSKDEKLTQKENDYIEKKAEKYDIFTRMKGSSRTHILLKQLLEKVDIIPPSIMISTAAIYTNWGMSRLARQANALYRDEIWYQKEGLKPLDDQDAEYRYKIFSSLEDCISSRALKLNSHINYDYFRAARKIDRKMGYLPFGPQMAAKMIDDSNLKNIAGLIDYTFTFFQLSNADFFPQLIDVK